MQDHPDVPLPLVADQARQTTPAGIAPVDDGGPTAVHDHVTKETRDPNSERHVDLNYFDPFGMSNLQRRLTRTSSVNQLRGDAESSEHSDFTLAPGGAGEHFDFEKTLRAILKRYASIWIYGSSC